MSKIHKINYSNFFIFLVISAIFFSNNSFALNANSKPHKSTADSHTTQQIQTAENSQSNNQDDEFDKQFELFENSVNKGSIDDPYENFNRKIYKFNDTLDRYFLEHVARSYRFAVPKPARTCIRNFLDNLTLPISALNSFAQGKLNNGLATISTFIINSTLGVGGLFEVAKIKGINFEREDFGQTLGYYGVGSNKFLMLPFFGPSNPRDLGGFIFDRSIDPFGFNFVQIGGGTDFIDSNLRLANTAIKIVDNREELLDLIDNIRKDSFDPYSMIRSAYLQRRLAQIEN